MSRILVTGVLAVLVSAGAAAAGTKKKVQIVSTPPGASVYLGSVEDGELCKTPCPIDVGDGEQLLIVDLKGHKTILEPLVISRKEKPPFKRTYTLVATLGKIIIEGPKGANVIVDDEDKGKVPTNAPLEIEVEAGTHAVSMTLNGRNVYGQPVEVVANDSITVTGSTKNIATKPEEKPDPEDKPTIDEKPAVHANPEPSTPRAGNLFAISAVVTVGFRDFAYENPTNPNLTTESEVGQVLAGPVVELWPGTLAGINALRGLSLLIRFEQGLNSQPVKKMDGSPTSASTFWRTYEASLRHRWVVADTATLEVGAGFVHDEYTFSGNIADILLVPDVDYQGVRIGGRGSLLLGKVEPYVEVENRIVLSGGALEQRFTQGASANGLHAAAGVSTTFGRIGLRFEGSLTRYSWTFKNDGTAGADGASDSIKTISLVGGYAY